MLKEQLPGAARLRYDLGSCLSVHSWDFHCPSISQLRGFAAYRCPLSGNWGGFLALQSLRDPTPQPICDIHLSYDYTLLHWISKSPWCCREHVILMLDFCTGQGFSLIVVLLVPQWRHSILHSITITSLPNSRWERKVNSENLSYKQFTFLVVWFVFISMFTFWTGKLFGG